MVDAAILPLHKNELTKAVTMFFAGYRQQEVVYKIAKLTICET
jgi:hypothetical protein